MYVSAPVEAPIEYNIAVRIYLGMHVYIVGWSDSLPGLFLVGMDVVYLGTEH